MAQKNPHLLNSGHDPRENRGGARPGAGAKPSIIKDLERQIRSIELAFTPKKGEAQVVPAALYAFMRLCELMDDDDHSIARQACVSVMNRILGKIPDRVEFAGSVTLRAELDASLAQVMSEKQRKIIASASAPVASSTPDAGASPQTPRLPQRPLDLPSHRDPGKQGPRRKSPPAPVPAGRKRRRG